MGLLAAAREVYRCFSAFPEIRGYETINAAADPNLTESVIIGAKSYCHVTQHGEVAVVTVDLLNRDVLRWSHVEAEALAKQQ